MNEKMLETVERRKKLLAKIAAQRAQMTEIASHFRSPLSLADRGIAVARFFRFHSLLVAGITAFLLIRRRSVAGLVWGGWRLWKVFRDFTLFSTKLFS